MYFTLIAAALQKFCFGVGVGTVEVQVQKKLGHSLRPKINNWCGTVAGAGE